MGQPVEPDKYQQAWRADTSQTRVAFNADLLLKTLRQRNQQGVRGVLFGLTVIVLMFVPIWILLGLVAALPWTWYLGQFAMLLGVGFAMVRAYRKQSPSNPGQPLLSSVQQSVAQVEQEIRSLRNGWWSPLPIAVVVLADFVHLTWLNPRPAFVAGTVFTFVIFLAAGFFIYYVAKFIIRTQYEPKRQQLLRLLASLRDDAAGEVSGDSPMLTRAKRVEWSSRRRWIVVGVSYVACLSLAVLIFWLVGGLTFTHRPPERSPFAAVRWQQSQPEVRVGDEWFKLVSLDGIPASEIVAFSQRTYGNKWRIRFEEDLVALLTRMGHPPQDQVKLVVQSLKSPETRTLEGVPMTEANRQAIKAAAGARESSEP